MRSFKKAWNRIKDNPEEIGFAVVLAVQFFLILLSNLTMLDKQLDSDSARLMKHIMVMWERKTPVLSDWANVTTMEWDCTTLFAVFLYGITHNIYLACGISNIILWGGLAAVIFFLFRGEKKIYPLLCLCLISIPYRVGMLDYFNMLFFGGAQYAIKVTIPLLLVGLLADAERNRSGERAMAKGKIASNLLAAVYFVTLLISSMSSGVYVAACGLAPVFIVYAGYKFVKWEKIPVRSLVLTAGTFAAVVLGIRVNDILMGGSRAASMVYCSVYQMLANVSSCLWGFFELFGANTTSTQLPVVSAQGMIIFAKLCLVLAFLVLGVIGFIKCVRKQADLRLMMLIAVFAWNYLILNVIYARAGSSTYEYRYHLIGAVPLICAAVCVFTDWKRQSLCRQQQRLLSAISILFLVFLNLVSFGKLYKDGELNADLKELVAYCRELDPEIVYMYNGSNDAEVCRLLDPDHLYLTVGDDGRTWVYDYYIEYVDAPMKTEGAIVAVYNAEYNMGDSFEIQGIPLIKFDESGDRSLYYFSPLE